MGLYTDAKIEAWQKASGITPASGRRAEILSAMSQAAFELIKIIELEKSGIRDGDGHWHGSDVVGGSLRKFGELHECLNQVDYLVGNGHMTEAEVNAVEISPISF